MTSLKFFQKLFLPFKASRLPTATHCSREEWAGGGGFKGEMDWNDGFRGTVNTADTDAIFSVDLLSIINSVDHQFFSVDPSCCPKPTRHT